jgi:anti-sigma factor RsiW
MKFEREPHLTREELLAAAVDLKDIAATRSTHLNACPECRRRHERLTGMLARLGRTAQDLAPAPSRPFRLPESRNSGRRLFTKPLYLIGFTAALLLAIVIWQPQRGSDPSTEPITAAALAQDRHLMQSIDALVENALPAPYQALASIQAPQRNIETTIEDDFFDWIVPNVGTETVGKSLS